MSGLATRLYRGEAGINVVGRRKVWFMVAAAILLIALASFGVRGFKLGIDFSGGNEFQIPATSASLPEVEGVVAKAGAKVVSSQRTGGGNPTYIVRTERLDPETSATVKAELAKELGVDAGRISDNRVSAAWGAQVTQQAALGLLIFLVLVVIYLIFRFELRMAVAAVASLILDLVLTAGVYSLVGFEVTPSTIIGFLTILGFALYDVVVVFDKVQENTRGITASRSQTYAEAANLAVNQTLMRSINTSLVALLPVGGLLFIGAGLLGAGTLKDLGLVLFFGFGAAVYSSIFFATPVLVTLKEREPKFRAHQRQVLAKRAGGAGAKPTRRRQADAADTDGAAADGVKTAAGAKAAGTKATVRTKTAAGAKMSATATADDIDDLDADAGEETGGGAAAGTPPRVGARPAKRKRPSGAKPGSRGGKRR